MVNENIAKPESQDKNNEIWIDLRCAIENDPSPLDFVLPGLLSGTVGAVVSPGGVGKTMWALQAAVTVAGGPDLLNLTDIDATWTRPTGRVVYLSGEDPSDVLSRRIHAIGRMMNPSEREVVYESLYVASLVGRGMNLMDARWQRFMERLAAGTRLIIIDTLRRFHTLDENDGGNMAVLLGVMERICRDSGTAVLFLHHASKVGALNGADTQQASRGSSVLTDNARYQLNLIGMSVDDAKRLGVVETYRRTYVRAVVTKANYYQPVADRWYRRFEGGVLGPVDFNIRNVRGKKAAEFVNIDEVGDDWK